MIVPRRTRAWSSKESLVAACGESKLRNLLCVKQFSSHGVMVLKTIQSFSKALNAGRNSR